MGVDGTMALLYAQTSMAAPLAHTTAVMPQASHAMTSLLAQETARLEQQQVQKTETCDGPTLNARDGGGGGQNLTSRQSHSNEHEAEKEDDTQPRSPLVGTLLNLKV